MAEKGPVVLLRDLCVKLSRVYKDFYLYNNFCISGSITEENALGEIVCTVEPKYMEVINLLITSRMKNKKAILYLNPADIKAAIDNSEDPSFIEIIIKSEIDSVKSRISEICEKFQKEDIVWKSLGENEELIKTIYTDKAIFNMPIEARGSENPEYITIAKQILPIMTEKTIKNAFISITEMKDYENMYEVLIDFAFTHFHMWAEYHMISLPFL